MKRQVYAVFAFLGVVVAAAAFMPGEADPVIVLDSEDRNSRVEISEYGVANALLAVRGGEDSPFGDLVELNGAENLGDFVVDPFDGNDKPSENENNQQAGQDLPPLADPTPAVPLTICNLFIQSPEIGSVVQDSFSISGFVDYVEDPECYWTVFEGNAGGVEVYDNLGNLLTQYHILSSVGSWMQTPSYFQSLVQLVAMPESRYGYIRFYEHEVSDNPPVIFDYPVEFSEYGTTIASPDSDSGAGFFDVVSDFFRSAEEKERIEREREEASRPGNSDIFQESEDDEPELAPIVDRPRVEISPVRSDYCEIRRDTELVCYGAYISEDSDVCGCDTFPSLQTLRAQESVTDFSVDLTGASFEKTLFIGDRGAGVRELQNALFALGLYEQIPSGVYDGVTVKAVREFQHRKEISGWGLVVGKNTRAALQQMFSAQ